MRAAWSGGARKTLETLMPERRQTVEAEVDVMFADAIPGGAVWMAPHLLSIRLPCGAEVDFERIGDGVLIMFLASEKR